MTAPFPNSPLALVTKLDGVLAQRCLTRADAIAIGLTIVEAEDLKTKEELGFSVFGVTSAQKLPYFDINGHPIKDPKSGRDFCRYRLEYGANYKAQDGEKLLRYSQPRNSSGHITYVPREVGIDWLVVTADPKEPILFTEGEYKSIAGCKAGIATVGLAGINSIAQDSRKMTVPLQDISWVGRPVAICFDAHETSTEESPLREEHELKAAKSLANKMVALGAEPKLWFIAKTPTFLKQKPRCKMGLDDFLQSGGTLEELAATGVGVATEDVVVAELFREYCVCLSSRPFVMNRHDHTLKHSARDFKDTIVADKHVKVKHGSKGDFKQIPAGEVFIKSPMRPTFNTLRFDPSGEYGLNQDKLEFNTWTGMATQPEIRDAESFAKDIRLWRKYGQTVFGDDWDWVEKFMAHLVQRPAEKINVALVITGNTEGTGKTTLGAIAGALVGERYRTCDTYSVIFGQYGGANLDSKLIVQIEESDGLSAIQMNHLKNFITNPRVDINIKQTPNYTTDNLARVIFTSNGLRPVKVEETSRRFMVIRTKLTKEQVDGDPEKGVEGWRDFVGREIYKRFVTDESEDGSWPRRHLMYHLMNCVSLKDFDPKAAPPMTEAAEDMIEATASATDLGLVSLYGLLDSTESGFWVLPTQIQHLNSDFWNRFLDYLKSNRGGVVIRLETKVFDKENVTVRVLATARAGKDIPIRRESKGGGRFRDFISTSIWGKDEAAFIRAKNELIAALERVGPILRMSEDNIAAIRYYGGTRKY